MKGNFKYIVFLLVILSCILGPSVYNDKVSSFHDSTESVEPTSLSIAVKSESPAKNESAAKIESTDPTTASATIITDQQKENIAPNPANRESTSSEAAAVADVASASSDPLPTQSPENTTPTNSKEQNEWNVNLAVVGMNGDLLYGPGVVAVSPKNAESMTVLEVLDASGVPYTTSSRYPGLVESVFNQRNKGQGGWMYKINDQSPMMGASQMKAKKGDKVIWWYSQSISIPAPEWDQLLRK